jgi:hypothetical protein
MTLAIACQPFMLSLADSKVLLPVVLLMLLPQDFSCDHGWAC